MMSICYTKLLLKTSVFSIHSHLYPDEDLIRITRTTKGIGITQCMMEIRNFTKKKIKTRINSSNKKGMNYSTLPRLPLFHPVTGDLKPMTTSEFNEVMKK